MSNDHVRETAGLTLSEYLVARTRSDDVTGPPQFLSTFFDDSTDVVMVFRPDMVLDWASPSLYKVYGWDPATLVGTKLSMLDPFEGDVLASCMRAMESRADTYESVGRVRSADGRTRWTQNRHRMA